MIVEDFIMLGRTEPHETKKGWCICSAGYSKELNQFLRVYPLPFPNKIARWSRCQIPLERNPQDSRWESWKIQHRGKDLSEVPDLVLTQAAADREKERAWLTSQISLSIEDLNRKRSSLGIIKPEQLEGMFKRRDKHAHADRDELGIDLDIFTPDQNELIPQLQITNTDGTENRVQLLDWGCAEYLRKNNYERDGLWDALHLYDSDFEHLVFVGNNNMHRNVWLGIGLISYKRTTKSQLTLELR